jgi:L-arabinokinase
MEPIVVFFISGHGFGHASRQVEIINRLGVLAPSPILIRSAVSPDLLRRTVRVPYELISGVCDTGIIQASSISHDDAATVREAMEFYRTFEARVTEETARLADRNVRLIVGDVPPLAFAVARRLKVPAVAVANFTWDWIYETHPGFLPAGAPVLETIRDAYRSAALALELPFSCGLDVFPMVEPIPLIARRPTRSAGETRAHFDLPTAGRVALLSFGGYGLPALDLSTVDIPPGWTIVTTDRVSRTGADAPHVRAIVEDTLIAGAFRYEDLVAAVDIVITKPGYGIIAECIATGAAMLYTSRGSFREYDVLVKALPRFVRSRFIDQADLFAGRWRSALEALIDQPPPPERIGINGADVAAARIVKVP